MAYLQDLGVNLENAEMLVVAEFLKTPSIGEITRQGYVDGWKSTGYDIRWSHLKGSSTNRSLVLRLGKHTSHTSSRWSTASQPTPPISERFIVTLLSPAKSPTKRHCPSTQPRCTGAFSSRLPVGSGRQSPRTGCSCGLRSWMRSGPDLSTVTCGTWPSSSPPKQWPTSPYPFGTKMERGLA